MVIVLHLQILHQSHRHQITRILLAGKWDGLNNRETRIFMHRIAVISDTHGMLREEVMQQVQAFVKLYYMPGILVVRILYTDCMKQHLYMW